jgi:hypothetical protein
MEGDEKYLEEVIKFGKYKGVKVGQMDNLNYLNWMYFKSSHSVHGGLVMRGVYLRMKQLERHE